MEQSKTIEITMHVDEGFNEYDAQLLRETMAMAFNGLCIRTTLKSANLCNHISTTEMKRVHIATKLANNVYQAKIRQYTTIFEGDGKTSISTDDSIEHL